VLIYPKLANINNTFWGDVMMSYSQYLENYPLTGTENLNSQPLFYNHRFLSKVFFTKVGMMLVYRMFVT